MMIVAIYLAIYLHIQYRIHIHEEDPSTIVGRPCEGNNDKYFMPGLGT